LFASLGSGEQWREQMKSRYFGFLILWISTLVLPGCGSPADDDDFVSPDDDDDSSGAELVIRGTVIDGEGGQSLGSVTVTEFGSEPVNSTSTGGDGTFALTLAEGGPLDLQFVGTGYLNMLFAASFDLFQDGVFQLYGAAKELEVFEEDFGVPFDPTKAFVFVELGGEDSVVVGASVELGCPYASAWVVNQDDELSLGNTILAGGEAAGVAFVGVEGESCGLVVEEPPQAFCEGRAELKTPPNHFVLAFLECEP